MFRIYLAAVDMIPAAVVLIPLFGLLYVTKFCCNLRKTAGYFLFCMYFSAVYALVGIPNILYIRPALNLNIIPFMGMISDFKNSVLNVMLFVPLGFLLPVLWTRFRNLKSCLLFGFGVSLTIELLQILTFRATDINDLITNVFGAWLGYILARPVIKKSSINDFAVYDPFVLCAVSFGIMFFVHPILSLLIWDNIL